MADTIYKSIPSLDRLFLDLAPHIINIACHWLKQPAK